MCAPVDKSGASVVVCVIVCRFIFMTTSQTHSIYTAASSKLEMNVLLEHFEYRSVCPLELGT